MSSQPPDSKRALGNKGLFTAVDELEKKLEFCEKVVKQNTTSRQTQASSMHYVVPAHALESLQRTMRRLYTEDRLTGEDMRNLAQSLQAVREACIPAE
jgi:hypothetical protein